MWADDLTTFLKADGTINGLTLGRVYPNRVPQASPFPAISYNQVSGVRLWDVTAGPTGRELPRITINSWAARYLDVRTLADAVEARLDGFVGMMGTLRVDRCRLENEFDTFEEEAGTNGIHRVMQDYILSFVEGA